MVWDYGINSIRGGNTQTLKGVFFARFECIPRIKTHGSVSCGPRSRRATREYINRKKENALFTPM